MFTGRHFHFMDNKGRVSIPSRYREILMEPKERLLTLTNWRGYIIAFPPSEWTRVEAKFAAQPVFQKKIRDIQRFLISGAEECPLDRQNRILIPPSLRDYAQLSREVCMVGAGLSFEIWDRQKYEEHWKQLEESISEEDLHELLI